METTDEQMALAHRPERASMEPPPFGDGNLVTSWVSPPSVSLLQWSHRLSAMETRLRRCRLLSSEDRFNGATAFRRWKPVTGFLGVTSASMLQWSHRLSAMETGPQHGAGVCGYVLQWSHRLSAMETVAVPGKGHEPGLASMEPPPFGDGNTGNVDRDNFTSTAASMEPPPFGDGNTAG